MKEDTKAGNSTNRQQTRELPVAGTERPKIAETLDAHRGEHHVIVLQDFPDPDAISSAYAHKLISAKFDIDVDIIYTGRISHQQNIALVRLLGIELTHFDEDLDLSGYNGSIFVDGQGTTSEEIVQALAAAGAPPLIIVDHHEKQDRLEPEFSDIRRTGAAATIYTEYLMQGLLELNKSRREHSLAATALIHGIMTDTNGFIQAGPEDFQAVAFLSQYRDADVLTQIVTQSRSKQVMEIIRQALGGRIIVESFSIAGIGYVRSEDRDAIPQAADFLLTEENVHTAIVYGILTGDDQRELLIGSLRTSKLTLDPDGFLKEVFGKDELDHYFGGGKMLAGGFGIPVGFLSGGNVEDYRDLKWQVYDQQVKQKIFAKIGIEPD
ncbi:MAG TPA: bifunctional oligoribonuclease/PAP phosphatase NrnA [Anaerolineae bacterium]